jgi:hypothetical protein
MKPAPKILLSFGVVGIYYIVKEHLKKGKSNAQ